MIRGVYKFDNAALDIVKAVTKVKPEPWLHIAFANTLREYAIYVWDTRQVVETGTAPRLRRNSYPGKEIKDFVADYGLVPAKDNHKPLKGADDKVFSFEQPTMKFEKYTSRRNGGNSYRLTVPGTFGTVYEIEPSYFGERTRYDIFRDGKSIWQTKTLNEARKYVSDEVQRKS